MPRTKQSILQKRLSSAKGGEAKRRKIIELKGATNNYSKPQEKLPQLPSGRRILSISSIIATINEICQHVKVCKSNVKFDNENLRGLHSTLSFKCACNWMIRIDSDSTDAQYPITKGLAWGCFNAPLGHNDLSTLLTCMDVPPPTYQRYKKEQDTLELEIVEAAERSMKEAAEEEQRIAVEAERFVNVGGIAMPAIDVVTDGSWAVRSYRGHSYTSNYGNGDIIGVKTGKVLFAGIRQKYCYTCARYEHKNKEIPKHNCRKNWTGTSTAMEADIIKEGFGQSISKYHLVYNVFIADGDSSVFAAIKDIYPGIQVKKIECTNHLIRCMNTHLLNISGNNCKKKWEIPQNERRIKNMGIKFSKFDRLVRSISNYYHELGNTEINWKLLYEDLINVPDHVFGNHSRCRNHYCSQVGAKEPEFDQVKDSVILKAVKEAIRRPAENAISLIEKKTSNKVESFMSTVAKYLEGKRKNLGGGNLYKIRISAAVLQFNTTRFWVADAVKLLTFNSPNPLWKKRQLALAKRRREAPIQHKAKKVPWGFLKPRGDLDYGENPDRPDIPEEQLEVAIQNLQQSLQVTPERQSEIEAATRDQANSDMWLAERRNRITASNSGKIISLRDSTNNSNTLRSLLGYVKPRSAAIDYGINHEKDAISAYEIFRCLEPGAVKKCGLVVDLDSGIFAASPDGLVGQDGLLEVKCPYSIREMDPNQWVVGSPLYKDKKGNVNLRRTHNHFYQVVQQLHCTGRKWCDYFVWTPLGSFCTRIFKSEADVVWSKSAGKLERFWIEDMAPEIVDSRLDRKRDECRQPSYRFNSIPKTSDGVVITKPKRRISSS